MAVSIGGLNTGLLDGERILALGVYPDVGIAEARERRTEARKALAAGNDPAERKKEAKRLAILKEENSFEAIAREWYEQHKHEWVSNYRAKMIGRLETHVFPSLGDRPILTSKRQKSCPSCVLWKRTALLAWFTVQANVWPDFHVCDCNRAGRGNPVPDLHGALQKRR